MENSDQITLEIYRNKLTDLIGKNVNLRRELEAFIKSDNIKTENIVTLEAEIAYIQDLYRSQTLYIARLLDEKYDAEMEVSRLRKSTVVKQQVVS